MTKHIEFARPPKKMPHRELCRFERLQNEINGLRQEMKRCEAAFSKLGEHEIAHACNMQDATQLRLNDAIKEATELYNTYR